MIADELDDFIPFLRDNKVRVEARTGDVFHSGGKAYGYAQLVHGFDADQVNVLYRTWKQAQRDEAASPGG